MKKGQVTFFVFIGILILFVLWFLAGVRPPSELRKEPLADAVTAFVQGCHDRASRESVFYLGFIGGKPQQWPLYFVYDENYRIPYYYANKKNYLAENPLSAILERSLESRLPACLGDFKSFPAKITFSLPETTAVMAPDEVILTTKLPITIYEPTYQTLQTEYISHLPVPLKKYVDAAEALTDFTAHDEFLIPWPLLNSLPFNATAYIEKDKTLIYRFADDNVLLFSEPYIFQFAVRVQ